MTEVDVLVVGAGPVGLTAAVELRRHGVDCRVVDRLPDPVPYAKAVGVQPRTLEVWDAMGLAREVLDAAEPLIGQLGYVNGRTASRLELDLPPDIPYGFAALPQYETERLLAEHLATFGTRVERGTELVSLEQDAEHVRARLALAPGKLEEEVTARYVIGCDGAHSTVRRELGLRFEGDAFPEEYMLGDVEVDWDLPRGYAVRSTHQGDGGTDDLLVCVPLPGERRYRMSMLVPPELSQAPGGGPGDPAGADEVQHGLESRAAPDLADIQQVLDRLAPCPVTASRLRWSSVFRISHRLVDRYGSGRVFVAGDAAHIHPPTGAQGMNTGIQDAYNLAWKLALALKGLAADRLLDSYQAERHPVGAEVVGRTVQHARTGFETDAEDVATVIRREAQLLIGYTDSPIVTPTVPHTDPDDAVPPFPGDRAPDCGGLRGDIATYPVRLFDLLRGGDHTLLLYAAPGADPDPVTAFPDLAALAHRRARGHLTAYTVLAPGLLPDGAPGLPTALRDTAGEFRAAYRPHTAEAFLVRPDGHLGLRCAPTDTAALRDHLSAIFAAV
ncbi:FAD-dependent monooxygenase [Streptomyces sp. SL13]|uniref:FAD-dependent monooxygenase n=1 Tax=Streptantibioticus silvisoli TaxID=2705255 RepID=A0AA90JXZ7_9ACTN|nr:FAD-dependent monooxygenase [Streptantibioticus silvisoli]MDI5970631.1 FAD-dependent monooxygenase [Streptantibioticus silvisoli]